MHVSSKTGILRGRADAWNSARPHRAAIRNPIPNSIPVMRSIFFVSAVLALSVVPVNAAAQRAHSVFVVAGEGGGGTGVMDPDYAVNAG